MNRKSRDATLLAGNCALACFARCGCRRDIGVAGVSGADPICRERTRTGRVEFNELVRAGHGSPKRASGFLSFFRGIETNRRRYRFPAVSYVYRPCAPIEARQLQFNPNSYVTYLQYVRTATYSERSTRERKRERDRLESRTLRAYQASYIYIHHIFRGLTLRQRVILLSERTHKYPSRSFRVA